MTAKSIIGHTVVFVSLLMLAPFAGANDETVEQSALDFQSERFAAMVEADIDRLDEILADELSYAHTTGWVETKEQFIQTVASGVLDYQAMVPRDTDVRIYGEIAVITGFCDLQGLLRGEPVSLTIRFLDVSRRVGDAWQLVAWQSTRVPED